MYSGNNLGAMLERGNRGCFRVGVLVRQLCAKKLIDEGRLACLEASNDRYFVVIWKLLRFQ